MNPQITYVEVGLEEEHKTALNVSLLEKAIVSFDEENSPALTFTISELDIFNFLDCQPFSIADDAGFYLGKSIHEPVMVHCDGNELSSEEFAKMCNFLRDGESAGLENFNLILRNEVACGGLPIATYIIPVIY